MTSQENAPNARETRKEQLGGSYSMYSSHWEVSASSLAEQGAYSWMADSIGGLTRVLEIGTGTGHSTLELLRRGHSVVSIDENPICLEAANRLLKEAHKTNLLLRGTRNFTSSFYQVQYAPISAGLSNPAPGEVLFIEGDVCNDDKLLRWLTSVEFDAVACWLIGTHPLRQFNEVYERRRKRGKPVIETDSDYRFWTQNTVYELADKVLRPSGRLSVVDRGKPLGQANNRVELYRSHRDQASVTSLSARGPEGITEFDYTEVADGVPLRGPGFTPVTEITLHCVTSEKS